MRIEISVLQGTLTAQTAARLRKRLQQAGRFFKITAPAELSLVFMSSNQIRNLNQRYRKKAKATTTLSFPQSAEAYRLSNRVRHLSPRFSEAPLLLGEIFFCLPEVKKYAQQAGLSVQSALEELAIHSFLHLLGYHHATQKESKVMEQLSRKIFAS